MTLTSSTGVLAIVDSWVRIPRRHSTSSNNDLDAGLLPASTVIPPSAARRPYCLSRAPPSPRDTSSANHANTARFRHSFIIAAVAAAVTPCRDMDDDVKVGWPCPLARDASTLHRLLHTLTIVNDDGAPSLYSDKSSNTSFVRLLIPIFDGKLRLGAAPAATRGLDVYVDNLARITQSREFDFLHACTHTRLPPDAAIPARGLPRERGLDPPPFARQSNPDHRR